jgi:hypothetical protein
MKFLFVLPLLFCLTLLKSQTIQLQFCGKTGTVSPSIDPVTGNDQREKASIRLDWVKIGLINNSKTNPIFNLGDSQTGGIAFANKIIADKCENNTDPVYCSQCINCNAVAASNNAPLGFCSGKLTGNVAVITKNNDLYMMSTNVNNVVCYETHKIDVSSMKGKKIDLSIKYEGISQGWPVHNISLNYRYNNDAYFRTPFFFNKNSNNVGLFEETYSIVASVPVAVEDLSKKLEFSLSPNPVKDEVNLKLETFESFDGQISVLDATSKEVYSQSYSFITGNGQTKINTTKLPEGIYILKISDKEGRSSTLKFNKF